MIRQIKRVEEVKIGDWYEGYEVKAVKVWGRPAWAVDLHLDDGSVKMLEAGLTVVIVTSGKLSANC